MYKIIDSHSHFMPEEVGKNTMFFKAGWSNIEKQIDAMDKYGIEKALLLYPTSDAHTNMGGWSNVCDVYNQELASVVKKYKSRFIGAGILPVDDAGSIEKELSRIKELGLKVISLASSYDGRYLDDEMFASVFDFARDNDIPVYVHSQIISPIGEDRVKDPLLTPVLEYVMDVSMCIGKMMMEGTFAEYPDVKFIFAHYGGVVPFVRERFDNTYQMLRDRGFVKDIGKLPSEYFKNIYYDTSGSKSEASLLCMLETAGSENILFGSDYPANQNVEMSIKSLAESAISEKDKKNILENSVLAGL